MSRKEIIVASSDQRIAAAIDALLGQLASGGVPAGAEKIYAGGRNSIYRLDIEGIGPVSIKEFKVPHFPNNYVYCGLRASKARRSFEHAGRLIGMGFLTPRPYGWVEVRGGMAVPRLERSYYVCEHSPWNPVRDWEEHPATARRIAECIGRGMARLHSKGVLHRDFSRGNVLCVTGPDGDPEGIALLDLNRMDFDVKSQPRLLKMFEGLAWTDWGMRWIVEYYCDEWRKLDASGAPDFDSLMPKVAALQQRFIRKFKKKYHITD